MRKTLYTAVVLLFASCAQDKPETTQTDFCSQIHRNDSINLSDQLRGLENRLDSQTAVYVLEDGAGSMVIRVC